jgi:signal transduction histidine kinase/CheY-like chemotaxis protein
VMLLTGWYLWRQGLKHARFYALGWSAFLAGGALLSLTVMGVLPLNFITEHGVKIGSVIEVVLLSFALADRVNMERAEKQIVQQKMQQLQFDMYKENFRKKEQAVAAEAAIRAKDEFLSTMSHEIRTPMNGVVGVLQLFQDTPINAEQKELLRIMNGSAQTLLSIINDILDFSKIQAGKMQIEAIPFNLHELLQDLSSLYSMTTKLKDNTEFVLDIASDVPGWVVGDPVRVKQILTNYLNNAVKFTTQGRIELHAKKDIDDRIHFAVVDSGIGISAEGLGKLFQSFSQANSDTSRKYGGTGLGLSICKNLSALMGGDVGASSVPGQGSTFWCSVRLQACAPPASADSQQLIGGDTLGHLRILVAEDNSVNQFVVRNMLKKLGIPSVDIAENGEEAFRFFCSRPYDLILMDCQMPVKDGFEATGLIRDLEKAEHQRRIPIAALTASATQEEQQRCRDVGMDFHIAKPLRLEDLKSALEYLVTLAVAA